MEPPSRNAADLARASGRVWSFIESSFGRENPAVWVMQGLVLFVGRLERGGGTRLPLRRPDGKHARSGPHERGGPTVLGHRGPAPLFRAAFCLEHAAQFRRQHGPFRIRSKRADRFDQSLFRGKFVWRGGDARGNSPELPRCTSSRWSSRGTIYPSPASKNGSTITPFADTT